MDRHKQRAAATRRTPWVVAGPFVAGPFVSGPFVAGLAICPATALAQADPQPTPAAIVDQVAQRDRAEALVQRLLETEDPDSQTELETELATLGESAAVALRLATLTGDFQQRQWADAAASRLRWRQAAGPDLLSRHDDLVATMARGNPQQRGALVDILAAAEDPQALGFFIECLTDDQPYVQRRAVDALVAIAEQARRLSSVSLDPSNAPTGASPTDARSAIVAQFTTLLATGDDETRVLVVGALSKMRHADLEALADLLDSPSEELRRTAIRALGHSGSTAAIPHLTPMLSDDRWQVRAATLDALEELVDDNRSKTQVGRAVSELLNDEDAFIRKRAIALIGEIEYTAARPELHAMLQAGNGDPKALLAALVALNDHRAAQQIRPRFESAQTTGEKQQWLTLLASAGEDAATDQLLAAILQDPEQRPLWATAVYAIDRRDQTSRHLTLIAGLLLDQDQDVADAAYRAMRYEDDPPLPTGVLDRLAQHDDPERRRWALNLLYTQRSDRLGDKLAQALNDPDTAVVRLALTMLSAEAGEPMPGVSLPYRRDQNSSYTVDVNGVATQDSTANTAPPAWVAIARDQLDRDLDIAVPAAALLYHTAEWQEDPVPAVLRRGMSSEAHPQLSGVALWAVKNNPDPFEADLDLVALAQQPSSRDAAIQIMAASTTGRYLPHLKELAKDATLEDAALVRALVVSNDDDAIAEALRLYNVDPDSWEANQAIEALSHAPGRGPVRFATALLDANPRYPSYRLPDMILSLPDPSAAPLLLRVAESNDYWVEPERVMTRLMEINPQSAAELSRQMLMGDQTHQIDSAIAALVQTVPNDDAAALALRAMSQQTAAAAAATWDPLVEWLPKAFVRDALPADLANLNPTAGQAVMRRLARDASPEDLRALLAANWSDVRAREPLAQIVARLTADNPAARPKLDTLEPGALALMLSAAAEWPDALDTVSPYLEHPDPRVAHAAVTGLALHAASAPPPDLTEAQQTALVRAAQAEEPRTAYLAVEALAQAQPSALQRLEPDSIQGPAARTRAALAGVDTDPGVFLGQLVNGAHGHTPLRFASLLALQQGEAPPAQLPSSYAFRYHHDLLTRHVAAQTHPNPDWVAALLEFHELPETFAGNAEVMSSLVEHARSTKDAVLLSLLGRNGLVADPQPQDVVLLLDNLRKFLNRDRGGWETDPTSSLLIAWAEAADPQEMRSRMKANSAQGVTAAAILALGHQDSQAIDLLAALVTQPPTGRQLQRASTIHRRMLALDTLALLNHQAIVPSLVEQTRDADASDWHRSQYTDRLVLTIAALDPTSAAQLPATSRRSQYTGDLLLDASTVTLMLLDQTASPQTANAQPAIQRPPTPSPLLQGLEAERTPPLPDRAQREELLPPWPARTWNTEDAGSFHHWYEPEDGAAVAMPASTGAAGYYLDLGAPTQDKHHTETATTPSNDLLRARLLDPDIKPPARTSVLRAIASGGHTDLIPDLTRLLKAPAPAYQTTIPEIAWALAWLQGPRATTAVAHAYDNADTFDQRVQLAGLLELLGDERSRQDLDRAAHLLTVRRLRARTLSIADPPKRTGSLLGRVFGGQPDETHYQTLQRNLETPDATPPDAAVPWWRVVSTVRGQRLSRTEDRLFLDRWAPTNAPAAAPWPAPKPFRPVDIRLSLQGHLSTPAPPHHGIPVPALIAPSAPLFAKAMDSEAASEATVFVQLAHRTESPIALRDAWRAWWTEHHDAGWRPWWWQGLMNAEEELTHPQWWHRTRGLARLRRLTGKAWPLPPIFDTEAWTQLQGEVQSWRVANQDQDPATLVVTLAIEAGLSVPEDLETDPLAQLTHLAAVGDRHQSTAARMILNHWPDKPALLAATSAWLTAHQPELRRWARDQHAARTGKTRLYRSDALGNP